jgi:hypothetical protein
MHRSRITARIAESSWQGQTAENSRLDKILGEKGAAQVDQLTIIVTSPAAKPWNLALIDFVDLLSIQKLLRILQI